MYSNEGPFFWCQDEGAGPLNKGPEGFYVFEEYLFNYKYFDIGCIKCSTQQSGSDHTLI